MICYMIGWYVAFRIQWRLLAESKLTFEKAFELAQAAETADSNARALDKGVRQTPVGVVCMRHSAILCSSSRRR